MFGLRQKSIFRKLRSWSLLYKVTLHFNCRFTKISLPAKRKRISYEDRVFNAKIHLRQSSKATQGNGLTLK